MSAWYLRGSAEPSSDLWRLRKIDGKRSVLLAGEVVDDEPEHDDDEDVEDREPRAPAAARVPEAGPDDEVAVQGLLADVALAPTLARKLLPAQTVPVRVADDELVPQRTVLRPRARTSGEGKRGAKGTEKVETGEGGGGGGERKEAREGGGKTG